MCDFCKSNETLNYKIESEEIKGYPTIITACPNCILEKISKHELEIPSGAYFRKIDFGQRWCDCAVKITSVYKDKEIGKPYYLLPEEAIRFLGHQLTPDEYFELITEEDHSSDEYDLHDDYYDDIGLAICPVDPQTYIKDLERFLEYSKDLVLDPTLPIYTESGRERVRAHIDHLHTEYDETQDEEYES